MPKKKAAKKGRVLAFRPAPDSCIWGHLLAPDVYLAIEEHLSRRVDGERWLAIRARIYGYLVGILQLIERYVEAEQAGRYDSPEPSAAPEAARGHNANETHIVASEEGVVAPGASDGARRPRQNDRPVQKSLLADVRAVEADLGRLRERLAAIVSGLEDHPDVIESERLSEAGVDDPQAAAWNLRGACDEAAEDLGKTIAYLHTAAVETGASLARKLAAHSAG